MNVTLNDFYLQWNMQDFHLRHMCPHVCVRLKRTLEMSGGYKHRHQFPYDAIYSAGKTGTVSNEFCRQICNKRQ